MRETYVEVSPSGKGLRLFALGKVDQASKHDALGIEVYGDERYLTVTGEPLPGAPEEIRHAPRTIARLVGLVDAAREAAKSARKEPEAENSTVGRKSEKPANRRLGSAGRPDEGASGADFFRQVNDLALRNIEAWVKRLFPKARRYPDGKWRISSADLGRDLEEDISIHPSGIQDFGLEQTKTAVSLYAEHMGMKPEEAALQLCEAIGVEPVDLGWRSRTRSRPPAPEAPPELDGGPDDAEASRPARKKPGRKPAPGGAQHDRLIKIGLDAELFFHDYTTYATVLIEGREETYKIRSRAFRHWLSMELFRAEGTYANGDALKDAIDHLEGAAFRCQEREAHIRVAGHEGCIYVDLANAKWEIVRITSQGWSVIPANEAPVKFIRTRAMRPMPRPETGGSLADLLDFINLKKEDDVLLYAWLVQAFNPAGPYPILAFINSAGSGKTTGARILRALTDPNAAPVRTMPKEARDVLITAKNSRVLAYDNISSLGKWLPDILCSLATGGGYAARELHTDEDEIVFEAMRTVILNGIPAITKRPDLADRAIVLAQPKIPKSKRKGEAELWRDFEEQWPFLLGAIFDAVAGALSRRSETRPKTLPRMADFALFALAAEPSMPVKRGSFMKRYAGNIEDANRSAIENSAVGTALLRFMEQIKSGEAADKDKQPDARPGEWSGTMTELLKIMREYVDDSVRKSREFPGSPLGLTGALRRLEGPLETVGITMKDGSRGRGKSRKNVKTIKIS
jgi:hypothetical protein